MRVGGRGLPQVLEEDLPGEGVHLGDPRAPRFLPRHLPEERERGLGVPALAQPRREIHRLFGGERTPRRGRGQGEVGSRRVAGAAVREGQADRVGARWRRLRRLDVGRAGTGGPAVHEPRHDGPDDEAADVGAVGDASLARRQEGQQVVDEQVPSEHEPRRHLEDLHQEGREEGEHPHACCAGSRRSRSPACPRWLRRPR